MQLGVFIPIGNNGWLISSTSPQYIPSSTSTARCAKGRAFRLRFCPFDDQIARVWGPVPVLGLRSGIVHTDGRAGGGETAFSCLHLRRADHAAAIAARMAVTINSISHGRFGINIISGWQRREYTQIGIWPGANITAGVMTTAPNTSRSCASCGKPAARIRRAISSRWTIAAGCRCRPPKSR